MRRKREEISGIFYSSCIRVLPHRNTVSGEHKNGRNREGRADLCNEDNSSSAHRRPRSGLDPRSQWSYVWKWVCSSFVSRSHSMLSTVLCNLMANEVSSLFSKIEKYSETTSFGRQVWSGNFNMGDPLAWRSLADSRKAPGTGNCIGRDVGWPLFT